MEKYKRPSWDEYFMEVVDAVAKRGTCDRGRGGCVLVRDNVILATGYVGAPKGSPHCDDVGHLMKEVKHEDGTISKHCMRTAHTEANAVCQAAKNGVSIDGATCYSSMLPCPNCAMLLVNSGIIKVISKGDYHGPRAAESREIFKNAGVEVAVLSGEVPYDNK